MTAPFQIVFGALCGGLFLAALLVIFVKYLLKRRATYNRAMVEENLNEKLSFEQLFKRARKFAREEKFAEGVIVLFYLFRLYSKHELAIRTALTLPPEELPRIVSGAEAISLRELKNFIHLYKRARFTSQALSSQEYCLASRFISNLIEEHG